MSARRSQRRLHAAFSMALLVLILVHGLAPRPTHAKKGDDDDTSTSTGTCNGFTQSQVQATSAFSQCYALTHVSFNDKLKKNDDPDPTRAKFCGSADCLDVFRQLRALGGLLCLGEYSTKTYSLWTEDGGLACFGPAALEVPTLAPVPMVPDVVPDPQASSMAASSDGGDDVASQTGSMDAVTNASSSSASSSSSPSSTTASASSSSFNPVDANKRAGFTPSNSANAELAGDRTGSSPNVLPALAATSSILIVLMGVFYLIRKRRQTGGGGSFWPPSHRDPFYKRANTTREQRAKSTTHVMSDGGDTTTGISATGCEILLSTGIPECHDEIINSSRVPFEKIEFGALLSHGGYGQVYVGSYIGRVVAIKTLLPEHRNSTRQITNFLQETKLLATLEHVRIVQFLGVAWNALNELSVIMEFMENGDLRSLLSGYETNGHHRQGFHQENIAKVQIALHVAHALMYLHSLESVVLHRDLKSRNILLDNDLNAKLTDFGVSRERGDCTMTAGVGSSLWMAPEVMMGERYDEKADIFSFGVVLSELDNHVLPYTHALEPQTGRRLPETAVLQMVSMGLLSVHFTDMASEMAQLGRDCVALLPADRPPTHEVLHRIHQVHEKFQAQAQADAPLSCFV